MFCSSKLLLSQRKHEILTTSLQTVLLNHVLNISAIYSSELAAGNLTDKQLITTNFSGFTLPSSDSNSTTNTSFVTADLVS